MNSGKYIARTVFTFHQWKGKGYAVFASLGKLIRIGKLSTAVSQNFVAKDVTKPDAFLNRMDGSDSEEESGEFRDALLLEQLALLLGIQPALIAVNKNSERIQPSLAAYRIFYFLIKVRFLLRAGNGLFYCYKS